MRIDLKQQAADNLVFIREYMERTERVSAVSGIGGILMGLVAFGAMFIATTVEGLQAQLLVWISAAFPAVAAGVVGVWRKARRLGGVMIGDAGIRFSMCLLPAVIVAALMTWLLWATPQLALAPALWMMLYGCGLLAAGTVAVPPVMLMGVCFFVTGTFAGVLATQVSGPWNNLLLGLTFGGLHILFGFQVYRRYGG